VSPHPAREGFVVAQRFKLGPVVGEGASALVCEATDLTNDVRVALKVLRKEFASSPDARQAFLEEAHLMVSVRHPAVTAVIDFGEYQNLVWIAYEYAPGVTLASFVATRGTLSESQSLYIAREIGSGLSALHAAGLVHRDITPNNIMVNTYQDELGGATHLEVRLIDFGLTDWSGANAKGSHVLHRVGQASGHGRGGIVGSANYISPEQARGEGVDARGDVYQLGCVLFFSLIGYPPFPSDKVGETLTAHVRVQPLRPSRLMPHMSPAIDAVVLRALQKDPQLRFENMLEFNRAMKRIQEHHLGSVQASLPGRSAHQQDVTRVLPVRPSMRGGSGTRVMPVVEAGRKRVPLLPRAWRVTPIAWVVVSAMCIIGVTALAVPQTASVSDLATGAVSTETPTPTPTSTRITALTVRVPVVTGLTADAARKVLIQAKLVIGVEFIEDAPALEGIALGTKPAAAELMMPGAAVTLMLASGYNTVPTVASLAPSVAAEQLRTACFKAEVSSKQPTQGGVGFTLMTDPPAGTRAKCGTEVNLTNSVIAPTGTPTPTLPSTPWPEPTPSGGSAPPAASPAP
jgi:tRNA A-37 threonylcarbamoyl transferase component Bud32